VYRTHVAEVIDQLLTDSGEKSLQRLLDSVPHRVILHEEIEPFDPDGLVFRSINTPADYLALLGLAREATQAGTFRPEGHFALTAQKPNSSNDRAADGRAAS